MDSRTTNDAAPGIDSVPYDVLSVCLAPTLQRTLVFDSTGPAPFRLGEVNRALQSRIDASGKGVNASRAIAQSGGRVVHLTYAPDDAMGAQFKALAESCGMGLRAIRVDAPIRTCTTIIEMPSAPHGDTAICATELVEECPPVPANAIDGIVAAFTELLPSARVVLLSGKSAAGFPSDSSARLARLALEAGKIVVVDQRGNDLERILAIWKSIRDKRGAAARPAASDAAGTLPRLILKPNAAEFTATFPAGTTAAEQGEATLEARVDSVARETGAAFLVTRGADAAILAPGPELLPVRAVRAINPVGSGDACAGGLALALARGQGLRESCEYGLELGTLNALTLGPGNVV